MSLSSMVEAEPQDAIAWSAVVAILETIDDLPEGSTGLLSYGAAGGIFVEQNRICWAASNGLRSRLSELLRDHAGISPTDFRDYYERCRVANIPIGQQMVEEGLISADHFADAVLHHSAESLIDICRHEGTLEWYARAERGYAPQYTFDTVDLLLATGRMTCGAELIEATLRELEAFCGDEQQGIGFWLDHDTGLALPLATRVPDGVGVRDLLAVGDAAVRMARAAGEMGNDATVVAATTADQQSLAVWWRDGLIYAAPCVDRRELAAVTMKHLQRGA